ncbi:MAG TPA: type II toxin-antitoxin system prevent-host-death family antitoxin [Solirubrobacteraceae bacterium]|nr:type II toxin-antitoxin system prevent-host-death family antitoxin [Solirubrobacteraceae bacterium]
MTERIIPQRDLRNRIGEILREAEAGTEFTVTVRGRPVAKLGPPDRGDERAVDVTIARVREVLGATPVDDDFAADIMDTRTGEVPAEDPWRNA